MLPKYEIRKTDLTVKRNDYELLFPEHIHKYIEIAYVFKGRQKIKADNEEFTLNEGDCAVIFPDMVHSYPGSRQKGYDVLILMCDPKLFGALFPDIKGFTPESPFLSRKRINDKLRFAFNSLDPNAEFSVNFSWTCVIMSYLLEIIKPKKREKAPVEDMTYKIVKYIEENYTDDIDRKSLAKAFNVSECYISRIFSNNLHMNLRNYLGLLRTEYAASLIRTSNYSLTEIGQMSGFGSIRTFNRIFKAAYGIAPNEYRTNISRFISGSDG